MRPKQGKCVVYYTLQYPKFPYELEYISIEATVFYGTYLEEH